METAEESDYPHTIVADGTFLFTVDSEEEGFGLAYKIVPYFERGFEEVRELNVSGQLVCLFTPDDIKVFFPKTQSHWKLIF